MEPSSGAEHNGFVSGFGFGGRGSGPSAVDEIMILPASASLILEDDGGDRPVNTPSDMKSRDEGGNNEPTFNTNDADGIIRRDVDSPAPSLLISSPASASTPAPDMAESDGVNPESAALIMGNDHTTREATVESATAEDGTPADGDPEASQSQAQEQAADSEGETSCKICFTNLESQDFIFLNCGCLYCAECLNGHFRSGLANKASYPPRCCGQLPIDIAAVQGFLSDENMVRYTMVQEEFSASRPLYCANKDCGVEFIGDAELLNAQGNEAMVICHGCALETCATCRELRDAHIENEGVLECPDSLALAEVKGIAEEEKWRRCPGCRFLVEKIDGCDHMICDCRTEFHYVCGGEYGNDGRCTCLRNPGWADDGDEEDGHQEIAARGDLEDQLPPRLRADLHREEGFPFTVEEDTVPDPEVALQNLMEDTEVLLVAFEGEREAGETGVTTQAVEEVTGEGAFQTLEAQEAVDARGLAHPTDGEEHEVTTIPSNQVGEDHELTEDINLTTANGTLRAALDRFRNATEGLRTAAMAVVNERRRRAERALAELERANEDGARGAFGGGRRGRGR